VPSRQHKSDACHPELRIALEVEAERAQAGNASCRDIVHLALLVDVDYTFVAVPPGYGYDCQGGPRSTKSYRHCISKPDAIYGGCRLNLPLRGFLLVGY
jgi:hypothetical protein